MMAETRSDIFQMTSSFLKLAIKPCGTTLFRPELHLIRGTLNFDKRLRSVPLKELCHGTFAAFR